MNRISVLPEQIINKIAAGEVIERPASVVKELVENAIDAQASRIEITFEGDGTKLIRVIDNGVGMDKDDALLCLERHATSKIREIADINKIETLGFRGEAISSIAAVSKMEVATKERHTEGAGTFLLIHGGKIIAVKDAGVPAGTKISIRNLFYNTPARKKFLKTVATEAANIISFVNLISLVQNNIYFKLIQNDKIILDIPPSEDIKERIKLVYGKAVTAELIPFEFEADCFSFRGFLSKPSFTRANRSYQNIFVNKRIVQNKAVQFAINQGYERLIPAQRFPVALVFILVEPGTVDVNIHPAKKEVKFANERQIVDCLIKVIQKTLTRKTVLPNFSLKEQEEAQKDDVLFACEDLVEEKNKLSQEPGMGKFPGFKPINIGDNYQVAETKEQEYDLKQENLEKKTYYKIIGQFQDSYILVEDEAGLLIIDQHAAHERVLFERVRKKYRKAYVESQKLLFPQTIEFTKLELEILFSNLGIFNRIGFAIRQFGEDSVIVENIPVFIKNADISNLIRDIVSDIQAEGKSKKSGWAELMEEKIIRHCCRRAVMAYDRMNQDEMKKLIDDIFDFNIPFSCPHGRPIGIRITTSELEKKFKR